MRSLVALSVFAVGLSLATNTCPRIAANDESTCNAGTNCLYHAEGVCDALLATKKTLAFCSETTDAADLTGCPTWCTFSTTCLDPVCGSMASQERCNVARCQWDSSASTCGQPSVNTVTEGDSGSTTISTVGVWKTANCATADYKYGLLRYDSATFTLSEPSAITAAGGMMFTRADLTDDLIYVKVDDATAEITLKYQCQPTLCPSFEVAGTTLTPGTSNTVITMYAVTGHSATACAWTLDCGDDDTTLMVTVDSVTGANDDATISGVSADATTTYFAAQAITSTWISTIDDLSLGANSLSVKVDSESALTADAVATLKCMAHSSAVGFNAAGAAFAAVLVLLALF